MARHQLFEIHDCPWCPATIRNALTDFLQTATELLDTYEPIRQLLLKAITGSGARSVVDLCSGAGGPWVSWKVKGLTTVPVTLTDRFPNSKTIRVLNKTPFSTLRYDSRSIDATAVPPELTGFRTVFTAFHHFPPSLGKAVIDDAVHDRQGIAIFELTSRTLRKVLSMALTPIGVLLFTPKVKTKNWRVLILTYLIPVIPVITGIDGVLSCLRSYNAGELRTLATSTDYDWQAGEERGITYLIGVPKPRNL